MQLTVNPEAGLPTLPEHPPTPSASLGADILGAFAGGGLVQGSGGPTDDANLILASNGEFIVSADSAKKNMALLTAINEGRVPKLAGAMASNIANNLIHAPTINVTMNGGDRDAANQIVTGVSKALRPSPTPSGSRMGRCSPKPACRCSATACERDSLTDVDIRTAADIRAAFDVSYEFAATHEKKDEDSCPRPLRVCVRARARACQTRFAISFHKQNSSRSLRQQAPCSIAFDRSCSWLTLGLQPFHQANQGGLPGGYS